MMKEVVIYFKMSVAGWLNISIRNTIQPISDPHITTSIVDLTISSQRENVIMSLSSKNVRKTKHQKIV